jgi:hypothetical protein
VPRFDGRASRRPNRKNACYEPRYVAFKCADPDGDQLEPYWETGAEALHIVDLLLTSSRGAPNSANEASCQQVAF